MTQQNQVDNKNKNHDCCSHSNTYEKMGMYSGKMLVYCADCGKMLGPSNEILNKKAL